MWLEWIDKGNAIPVPLNTGYYFLFIPISILSGILYCLLKMLNKCCGRKDPRPCIWYQTVSVFSLLYFLSKSIQLGSGCVFIWDRRLPAFKKRGEGGTFGQVPQFLAE